MNLEVQLTYGPRVMANKYCWTKGKKMKTRFALVGLLLALNVKAEPFKTIDGFETPGAGSGGNPHGLAWDGSALWMTDPGQGKIFRLATNGTVLSAFDFHDALGLAWDGTHLWAIRGNGYGNDNDTVYELGTTGTVFSSFSAPGKWASGLAWDGECLWLTVGGSFYGTTGTIYRVSTSGAVQSSFPIPDEVRIPRDLEYDGQNLWLLDQGLGDGSKCLWHFTTTGALIGSYHMDSFIAPNPTYYNLLPYGIAYDGRHLWISGESATLRGVSSDAIFKVLPIPEFISIRSIDTTPVLEFRHVAPLRTCTVQCVPNLGLQWSNIWAWTSDGRSRIWRDDSATNLPRRFYRLVAD